MKKNKHAQALAKLRAKKMTKNERSVHAKKMVEAREIRRELKRNVPLESVSIDDLDDELADGHVLDPDLC
jgi:hypothetical protein